VTGKRSLGVSIKGKARWQEARPELSSGNWIRIVGGGGFKYLQRYLVQRGGVEPAEKGNIPKEGEQW